MEYVITKCTKLSRLRTSPLASRGDAVAFFQKLAVNLKNLVFLNIIDSSLSDTDSNSVICNIVENNHLLQQLFVDKFPTICAKALTKNCPLNSYLYVNSPLHTNNITTSDAILLAHNYPKLKLFAAAILTQDCDATVSLLGEQCRNLTYINLSNSIFLSDKGILNLATRCSNLRYLNVLGSKVSDAGHKGAVLKCSKLKFLILSNQTKNVDLQNLMISKNIYSVDNKTPLYIYNGIEPSWDTI